MTRAVALAALALLVVAGTLASPAAAAGNTTTPTPTETPTNTTTTTTTTTATATATSDSGSDGGGGENVKDAAKKAAEEETEYVGAVDATLKVVSYDYQNGKMTVTLESSIPQTIVLSDPLGSMKDSGVAQTTRTKKFIAKGKTTITMDVGEYRGMAAVSIATSRGAATVSTGASSLTQLENVSKYTAWFGGSAVAILVTVVAGYQSKRKEAGEPESGFKGE